MKFSYGHMGNSFAIPTKDQSVKFGLSLGRINRYVDGFLAYADGHRELEFQVTCIGTGLAGLAHADIAPMFEDATPNCLFDEVWRPYLGSSMRYWGTF